VGPGLRIDELSGGADALALALEGPGEATGLSLLPQHPVNSI
jgi:hypothetical protein